MKKLETENVEDRRLSYSSMKEMIDCESRWFFRKVKKVKADSDYDEGDNFMIGKAIHFLCEHYAWKWPGKIGEGLKLCVEHDDILLKEDHFPLVAACFKRATQLMALYEKKGFKLVGVEADISDSQSFVGYTDLVVSHKKLGWYIVDLKNFKSFDANNVAGLTKDRQLRLYAAHAGKIARMYDLPLEKFEGVMYWVVLKPGLKKGKHEQRADYTRRLYESSRAYAVRIPIDLLDLEEVELEHANAWRRAEVLRNGDGFPKKNYGNCMSYFKPCPYWSKCYGRKFTDTVDQIEVTQVSDDD